MTMLTATCGHEAPASVRPAPTSAPPSTIRQSSAPSMLTPSRTTGATTLRYATPRYQEESLQGLPRVLRALWALYVDRGRCRRLFHLERHDARESNHPFHLERGSRRRSRPRSGATPP